jgi:hypothetical protein
MAVFWYVAPCSLVEVYDVSEVLAASMIRTMSLIALMMEASTSETSVYLYQTTVQHPEDSHRHIRRRENLKSHKIKHVIVPDFRTK